MTKNCLPNLHEEAPETAASPCNLGQCGHIPNAGRDSETAVGSASFHPDDRCLAANPTLFALGELGRKQQHHFQVAPHPNFGIGVEEDAALT